MREEGRKDKPHSAVESRQGFAHGRWAPGSVWWLDGASNRCGAACTDTRAAPMAAAFEAEDSGPRLPMAPGRPRVTGLCSLRR